jgi:hypothetical protein
VATEDDQAKKIRKVVNDKRMRWASRSNAQMPPSTLSWLNTRKAGNRTIWNTKIDSPVSMGQVSTSTTGSSCGKRSRTPPQQNSGSRDHRQQDYHLMHYFSVGPPIPGPWGPLLMMYPPYPPWVGWYGPWAPPSMLFHPRWSRPAEGFSYSGFYAGDDRYGYVSHKQDRGAPG